jgi:hypothetical protein
MIRPSNFVSRFTNKYGEEWEFEYDSVTGEGTISGSDVDWRSDSVIEGRAVGLILDSDEIMWLRNAWSEAIRQK